MRRIKALAVAAVLAVLLPVLVSAQGKMITTTGVVYVRSFVLAATQTLSWSDAFIGRTAAGALYAGSATVQPVINGTLTTSTTSTCTVANTNETDLWTYSLPANALNANGRGVRITAWFTTAANTNTKTGRLYFGATAMTAPATAITSATVRVSADVLRTGASAQIYNAVGISGNFGSGTALAASTAAADTTGAITIKATGQNGTGTANDICFTGAIVETIK